MFQETLTKNLRIKEQFRIRKPRQICYNQRCHFVFYNSSYKKIKGLFQDAVKNYQESLAIEIATKRIKAMLAQADAEFPQLNISATDTAKDANIKEGLNRLLKEFIAKC